MAKSNYREYLRGEQVRLKKYFYVLRPILACRWIMERHTPPPMLFTELADACLPASLRSDIDRLLNIKIHSPEKKYGERVDALNDYIDNSLRDIEEFLMKAPSVRNVEWAMLNKLFLEEVTRAS